ncbi:DUF7159 family protein [Mycobacterium angelicum]|uniref:DUF7159 family protein n=1 Tax=Mycobacterium angelicum TaxID=470074 RepID=UPI00111C0BF5|nr:hypothetical protein [Mycobacterium angelicum]
MDVVLGVSMAPSAVRVAVVEGEDGDGAIVEEESFQVGRGQAASPSDQVISAILGTREGAADAGLRLSAIGVTWTDHLQAAALRDALAARKIENVMLVSAFLATAALGQAVGGAVGYERTAVLYIEPDAATLAVVDTADGSVSDLHRKLLAEDDDAAVAELVEMVSAAETLATHPEGVYVVGSGVDVPLIKPALDAATSLTVSVPEEPDMALARGAALASGNAPLFASSTAAMAYAQDACVTGRDDFAYAETSDDGADDGARRPALLVGSAAAVVAIVAVIALEIALAIGIRPTVALQPTPSQNHFIAPTQQAPTQVAAPQPKIDLPRPPVAPRALPPQAPAPVAPAPAGPVLPAAPVPEPEVVVPPVLPILVPPIQLPGPQTLLRPPVVQPPVRVPQPKVPQVRPQVPQAPRVPVQQSPRGRVPSLNPGRGPFGGHGPFGGGGHGGHGPFGGGGHGGFGGGHGGFGGGHGGFGGHH